MKLTRVENTLPPPWTEVDYSACAPLRGRFWNSRPLAAAGFWLRQSLRVRWFGR